MGTEPRTQTPPVPGQPHARVGALAAPGDPVDFAEKLAHVLADKSLAQHCRAYVAEHFSWDKTCMKLLAIYENLHARGIKDPSLSPAPYRRQDEG
jgi:hypothetical protein